MARRQQAVLGAMGQPGDLPEHTEGPILPGEDATKTPKPLALGDPTAPGPIEAGSTPPPMEKPPIYLPAPTEVPWQGQPPPVDVPGAPSPGMPLPPPPGAMTPEGPSAPKPAPVDVAPPLTFQTAMQQELGKGGTAAPGPIEGYDGPAMTTNSAGDLGGYGEPGGYAGPAAGGIAPGEDAPNTGGQSVPAALAKRFNLDGAQVHGRAADINDPNDLLWLASQQQGFDISSNDAAQRSYNDIINPLFQQQGINTKLAGKNLDRLDLGGGRMMDFVGNASNPDTSQRRFWVGDSANPGPAATTNGPIGSPPTDTPGMFTNAADGAPGMSNDPTAAGATANAPTTGFAPGWEDAGNGMARNPATGQMLPVNHPAYQALLASGGPAAGTPAAPGAPAAETPQSALQKRIMEMLNTNTADVSAEDPNLLPQVNAGRRATQRAEERARNMAAERRHAGGFGGTGALDTDIERLAQSRGEAEAGMESGLVADELQNRFGRVQNAMQMQAGIDAQDKDITHQDAAQGRDIALRDRLAQLDAAIRREQTSQQGQLGNRGMDLQDRQFWGQLGQNESQFGRQLGQSGQQFNDRLGFDIGNTNANNYYRWLMAGMGG